MKIRHENADDRTAIRDLTIEAFSHSAYGHNGEAVLIESLRNNCESIVSLVAEIDGDMIGHVLFSPALIRSSHSEHVGMALGPVSVKPEHQNRGIGGKLIVEGLSHLGAADNSFTVVVGNPAYYSKFGFQPARLFNLEHGFAGIPQDVLQIYSDNFRPVVEAGGGKVYYREEFGPHFEDRLPLA